jgi:NTE family protein
MHACLHTRARSIGRRARASAGLQRTHASGAGVLSYLLFEPGYCSELIELGYQDAMAQKARLIEFLQLEHAPAPLVTPVSA